MVKPKLSIDRAVRIQAISVRSAAKIVRIAPRSLGRLGRGAGRFPFVGKTGLLCASAGHARMASSSRQKQTQTAILWAFPDRVVVEDLGAVRWLAKKESEAVKWMLQSCRL